MAASIWKLVQWFFPAFLLYQLDSSRIKLYCRAQKYGMRTRQHLYVFTWIASETCTLAAHTFIPNVWIFSFRVIPSIHVCANIIIWIPWSCRSNIKILRNYAKRHNIDVAEIVCSSIPCIMTKKWMRFMLPETVILHHSPNVLMSWLFLSVLRLYYWISSWIADTQFGF